MQLLTRLILVAMLVVQSMLGLNAVQCEGMTATGSVGQLSASGQSKACPHCSGESTESATCSTGDSVSVCHCGEPRQDEPKTPPSDSKGQQVQQLLVILPALMGFLPPEPMPTPAVWTSTDPSPHRPTNSIQSLLCVWVV